MKRLLLILALTAIVFAVLLPFASTTPDGLQKLTTDAGNQQQPIWRGVMANYSVALGDPYISTLAAGLLGIGIVATSAFAVGSFKSQKKSNRIDEPT